MQDADRKLETIRRLQKGHTDRHEEAEILGILRDATPAELNHLLGQLNLADLLGDLDDRLLFGPDHRSELLRLLSWDRLADLTVASRAAWLDALQRGDTDSKPEKEAILSVFLGTTREDLTQLKNHLDAGSDHRDLQELLNHGLDDQAIRAQILQHIQNDAKGRPASGVKVLSDVDDTFYANWVDRRYPKKTVYPGVRAFYNELDRGPAQTHDRAGDVGFLTARPWDPVGLMENQTHKLLREHGLTDVTVLTGSLLHLLGNERIARKKVENFREYRAQYPEYDYVFIGDSGQGDVSAALQMLEGDPDAVRGVFIHDVVNTQEAARQQYLQQGIDFFDTYIGAAAAAFHKDLIQLQGLSRIAQAALAEFLAIRFDTQPQREAQLALFQRDLARINEHLPVGWKVHF